MADKAMLSKVRSLLDKAESTEFPAEAETYRAKAEELMMKYRIEEEEMLAKDQFALTPVPFDIQLFPYGSAYQGHYLNIFGSIARHTGIRVRYQYVRTTEGHVAMAQGVGYEGDVEYAEMLFTAARMVFADRLEPKINVELSDQVNVYRLRSAGMERVRIADIMWGNTDKVFLARVGRLYKAECAQRGEVAALSGRGVTGAAYREQYSAEFVFKLGDRLRQARDSAGRAGGTLVLAGREERITEAFYQRFPDMRPIAELGQASAPKPCERCKKTKNGCADHKVKQSNKDYFSTAAMRGREAGAAAAREVKLHRGGTDSIGGS